MDIQCERLILLQLVQRGDYHYGCGLGHRPGECVGHSAVSGDRGECEAPCVLSADATQQ